MNESEKNELVLLNEENIKDLIYEIRGQKVMLDFDLARIYGYETKNFNRQVKNNINKFPEDFMFQISKEELEFLVRCKNFTSAFWAQGKGGRSYLPYAFTEKGIYMLMTVLRGELAVKQSITLIRLFQSMKDYIVETNNLVTTNEVLKLSRQVNENTLAITKLKESNEIIEEQFNIVMDNFINPSTYKHFLILNGERIESDIAYRQIYSLAKVSIILIDDYIDIRTLQQLKSCSKDISITICSDNLSKDKLTEVDLYDFANDTGIDVVIKPTSGKIHDRYIVIDYNNENETIYHSGGSSKDGGNKITTIMVVENNIDYHHFIDTLLAGDESPNNIK